MICVICNVDRARVNTGIKKRDGGFIYNDEKGKAWVGRKCSKCTRKKCSAGQVVDGLIKCIECEDMKVKLNTGLRYTNNKKIYADQEGRRWNGNKCPDCRYFKEPKEKQKRICGCGREMDKNRYFKCSFCVRDLPSDVGEFIYC